MSCTFSIAALGAADTEKPPANRLDDRLRVAAPDLTQIVDTESTTMWTGTFAYQSPNHQMSRAGANVTIYKASKRVRIQLVAHDLSRATAGALEDRIAGILGAHIVSRHQVVEGTPTAEAQKQMAEPAAGWWKAWIPPSRSADREKKVPGSDEPGTYEAE